MSLLQFGHAGRKILVFPTSQGRFFEYEDNKMIAAVGDKLDSGEMQIYCVDSVDDESWYNKRRIRTGGCSATCSTSATSSTTSSR